MKVAVIGSRSLTDYDLVRRTLHEWFIVPTSSDMNNPWGYPTMTQMISGGAEGADTLAEQWADRHGIPKLIIRPDYAHHSPSQAPLIRNGDIAAACDMMVAFWDGNLASGTRNALNHAKRLKRRTLIVYF